MLIMVLSASENQIVLASFAFVGFSDTPLKSNTTMLFQSKIATSSVCNSSWYFLACLDTQRAFAVNRVSVSVVTCRPAFPELSSHLP